MNFTKLKHLVRYTFGIPKSIYVNLRLLPFLEAVKMPIIVSSRTKLSSLRGTVDLPQVKTGLVRIGFGSIKLLDYRYNRTILHIEGTVKFLGKCKVGQGSRIEVAKGGMLECGDHFIISGQSQIICHKRITIGNHSLFGWDSLIMDTDFHHIHTKDGVSVNPNKEITIGEKVWVGARTTILKGASIANGSVVASGALCAKSYPVENSILAGNPAKILKEGIMWSE